MNDARRDAAAMRAYTLVLRAYPSAFRARFEPGLVGAFADGLAHAQRTGRLATLRFWIATIADTCWFGAAERVAPSLSPLHDRSLKGLAMRSLVFDWRDALRSLRATPIVTFIAVLSVALGVGANTALFSLLDGLVLKSLPVRDPAALVLLDKGSWTNPIWEQIRDRPALFDGAFAWSPVALDLSDHGESHFVDGMYASGRMFDVLGVPALMGRVLRADDDARDGGPDGPVAVISYRFWQRQFAGTPDVVGRSMTLNHIPYTIVGVAPAAFAGPDVGRTNDIFIPLSTEALIRGKESSLDGRSSWWLQIMVRMKPAQTRAEAEAALRGVQPQIREATLPDRWPPKQLKSYLADPFDFVPAETGRSPLRQRFEEPLVVMLVVVGLVLLIACANIANLLLARAMARRQDLSVRLALGASRFRLARQLLAESLLLAGAGGLAGIGVAKLGSALLVRQLATPDNSVSLDLSIDWRVFGFAAGVTLLTAVFFGLGPALAATRISPNEALKAEGRSITGDRRFGLRNILVVVQVALSLVLVVAAGLFTRTFSSLVSAPLGFNPAPLVLANVNIRQNTITGADRLAVLEHLRDTAAMVPGVRRAALSMIAPLSGAGWNTSVEVDGPNGPETFGRIYPWVNAVTPGWFDTYGMHLVGGRDFSSTDRGAAPDKAIVNQAFGRTFFHGVNPLGRTFKASLTSPTSLLPIEVVGVVNDAVYLSPRAGVTPTIYIPFAEQDNYGSRAALAIAAVSTPTAALTHDLSAALTGADARTTFTFGSFTDELRGTMAQERLVAILAGFFGGLALLLAALGLYGVTAYAVNRRRTEIGVRMALGAHPGDVLSLVLTRVGWLVGLGIASGAVVALWASRFIGKSLLFGLNARDPVTFIGAVVVLGMAGALAGWLPARRASRIDPTTALREG